MWAFQNKMAFPAPRSHLPAPSTAGITEGERVAVITSDSVELHGWYLQPNPMPEAGRKAPGLIWFYGNMETVSALAPILRAFRPPGTGMLILDYRGYGESEGSPTETGLYLDAEAAWSYLTDRSEIDRTRIAVYGRSLGGAVALYLATKRPVKAVILESPFTSARAMAAKHYGFLPRFLVRLSLNSIERAQSLAVPLIVFHGADDGIAPIEMGRAVAEAGNALQFVQIEGAGHNDTYDVGMPEYVETVHQFLARHLNQ